MIFSLVTKQQEADEAPPPGGLGLGSRGDGGGLQQTERKGERYHLLSNLSVWFWFRLDPEEVCLDATQRGNQRKRRERLLWRWRGSNGHRRRRGVELHQDKFSCHFLSTLIPRRWKCLQVWILLLLEGQDDKKRHTEKCESVCVSVCVCGVDVSQVVSARLWHH